MSSCQTFRNKLGDIKVEDLQDLLNRYMSSPSQEANLALDSAFKTLKGQRNKLVQEYRDRTRSLLKTWSPTINQDAIVFEDQTQRVIFTKEINMSPRELIISRVLKRDLPIPDYFPSVIKEVLSSLDISGTNIEAMDYLEKVGGFLSANDKLTSMDRLKEVGGNLELIKTRITSLPFLEKVGGLLLVSFSRFYSFPRLQEVGLSMNLGVISRSIKDLFPSLRRVGQFLGNSFYVRNRDQEKELEELKAAGKISFDGAIKVGSSPPF